MFKVKALVGTIVASLWASSVAIAQTPPGAAYAGEGGNIQDQVDVLPAATQQTTTGFLPFTGLELAVIVGAALFLIAVGIVVRRSSRTKTKSA